MKIKTKVTVLDEHTLTVNTNELFIIKKAVESHANWSSKPHSRVSCMTEILKDWYEKIEYIHDIKNQMEDKTQSLDKEEKLCSE